VLEFLVSKTQEKKLSRKIISLQTRNLIMIAHASDKKNFRTTDLTHHKRSINLLKIPSSVTHKITVIANSTN